MKKLGLVLLVAMMIMTLAACECKHEWTEADCLTPKTCAKCEAAEGEALGHTWVDVTCEEPKTCSGCSAVEGEALGHEWVDAVCETPQTCSRCGETQGEALGHAMSKWSVTGENMSRICGNCNLAEEQLFDPEAYLLDNLVGHWDYMYLEQNGEILYPEKFVDSVVEVWHAFFAEDGSAWYSENGTVYSGQWTFDGYEENQYFCTLTLENGESMEMTFLDGEEDELRLPHDNDTLVLSQYSRYAPCALGSWATVQGEQLYSLTLHEDHTLTGQMNGEVTGTWYFQMIEEYGYSEIFIVTDIRQEEEVERIRWSWWSFETDRGIEQYKLDNHYVSLFTSTDVAILDSKEQEMVIYFNYATPEQMGQLQDAASGDWQKVMGTWNGIKSYVYQNNKTEFESALEDSIVFQEDGTCLFYSGGERKGAWEYQGVSIFNGQISYDYIMSFYGGISRADAQYYPETDRLWSEFLMGGEWVYYDFAKMTQEEKEIFAKGPELIEGSWSDGETYTLTVMADGTFTADIGIETHGEWAFMDYTPEEGYQFGFHYADYDHGGYSIYWLSADGSLEGGRTVDGEYLSFVMTKE